VDSFKKSNIDQAGCDPRRVSSSLQEQIREGDDPPGHVGPYQEYGQAWNRLLPWLGKEA
jgi:hypothetical protein